MRISIVAALLTCVVSGIACGATGKFTGDEAALSAARQAVAKRMDDWVAVLRADKTDSLADFWAENAQMFEPEAEFHNRAEFLAMAGGMLNTIKIDQLDLKSTEILVHDGATVAYQFGSVSETLVSRDGKTPPMHERLNFMARWAKQPDGVWRMDRFMETPMPKEPAAAKPK